MKEILSEVQQPQSAQRDHPDSRSTGVPGGNTVMGLQVEELRRGRFVPRSLQALTRNPPLLLVYSSDPAILDMSALGLAALNLTHLHDPRQTPRSHHHRKTQHLYKRSADEEEEDRQKGK